MRGRAAMVAPGIRARRNARAPKPCCRAEREDPAAGSRTRQDAEGLARTLWSAFTVRRRLPAQCDVACASTPAARCKVDVGAGGGSRGLRASGALGRARLAGLARARTARVV